MNHQNKSILDSGLQVCSICGKSRRDHQDPFPCGFLLTKENPSPGSLSIGERPQNDPPLEQVGNCPSCGNPIYGDSVSHNPRVQRTCSCK